MVVGDGERISLPPACGGTTFPAVMLRTLPKRVAERLLVGSGITGLARIAYRQRVLVLAYHNIVPDDLAPTGDLPLHLPVGEFTWQLDTLAETHDVIAAADLVRGARSGSRPAVVLTFDDAYCGAVTLGAEVLAKRGWPATIFVPPAFVPGQAFWWDALAGRHGLDPAVRTHALEVLGGQQAKVLEWARGQGLSGGSLPGVCRAATERDLDRARASAGISWGAHTWGHPNLTRLTGDELDTELRTPLPWLRERFPRVVPYLSYPYGAYDETVRDATARAGYEMAFRISGGWLPGAPGDPLNLPRYTVSRGLSLHGFTLRTSGLVTWR